MITGPRFRRKEYCTGCLHVAQPCIRGDFKRTEEMVVERLELLSWENLAQGRLVVVLFSSSLLTYNTTVDYPARCPCPASRHCEVRETCSSILSDTNVCGFCSVKGRN